MGVGGGVIIFFFFFFYKLVYVSEPNKAEPFK